MERPIATRECGHSFGIFHAPASFFSPPGVAILCMVVVVIEGWMDGVSFDLDLFLPADCVCVCFCEKTSAVCLLHDTIPPKCGGAPCVGV